MSVASMTGFARSAGSAGGWRWSLEIKSVNAKGLDLRLRLPAPFDRVEAEARARLGKALARGTCFVSLTAQREGAAQAIRIDEATLASLALAARKAAETAGLAPPTMDGLLSVRGVVEVEEAVEDEAATAEACGRALKSLDEALASLTEARAAEGAALAAVLNERLDAIEALTLAADANPARKPEAVRARLAESVAALMELFARLRRTPPASGGDPARGEGRPSRGAGPAQDPCGRRAGASRGRRRDRPASRLPLSGTRPRSEHALRQVEQWEPDRAGARTQGADRAVPRAGPERGVRPGPAYASDLRIRGGDGSGS